MLQGRLPISMHGITLEPKRTTRILFAVLAILVALSVLTSLCHLVLHWRVEALTQLADLDTEANLPTLYNVLLFFFGAALFLLHSREFSGKPVRAWQTMAAVFLFLGIDEGSQIHEKFLQFTKRLVEGTGGGELGGWLYYAWVIPYGLAAITLAFVLSRWFFGLSPALRKRLVISGIIYVFGAVFMEMAGGKVIESLTPVDAANYPWMPCRVFGDTADCWLFMEPKYIAMYTLEETFEMTGLILCIRALLLELADRSKQLSLAIVPVEKGT
ncbi:MAG: hypothetical protein IPL86_18240 [Flavobacteriales bacterium]|jgi:hypothetical protein|nr:hypothetical protein [Flavobacteriales bacterium]